MSSSRNTRAPRRNLSKVQQQLAAEEQERDQANRQKRHREYLERKARRDRKAASGTGQSRVRSQSSQSSRPSGVKVQGNTFTIPSVKKPQPTQSRRTSNGVTIEGTTFTVPGLRTKQKRNQGLTLADALSHQSKQALNVAHMSRPQKPDFKVAGGAFAAFNDSDDDDEIAPVIETTAASRAHQQAASSAWSNFRQGIHPPKPVVKAVVRTLPPKKEEPAAAPEVVEPESDSEADGHVTPVSTDGDYDSEDAWDQDDDAFAALDFNDEDGAW